MRLKAVDSIPAVQYRVDRYVVSYNFLICINVKKKQMYTIRPVAINVY